LALRNLVADEHGEQLGVGEPALSMCPYKFVVLARERVLAAFGKAPAVVLEATVSLRPTRL
jgi:hypothetical protein